jgi:hypothetical protein
VGVASMTAATLRRIVGKYKTAQEDPSLVDRGLAVLPAVGGAVGGALGAMDPKAFDPSAMFPELKRGVAKGSGKARIASGILGAGTGATVGWLPSVARDAVQAVAGPPPSRDSRTAPIMIKKAEQASSELRGRELLHYMWDELERLNGKRY